MGNNECREVYQLSQDVGMIPDPRMDSSFTGYLSINSSAHLNSDYMDVRHSLSTEQLGAFNHSLRAALGESGKVKQGGVGVVALALSFLFDILTQQAKNQTGTTHFIHQIFREHEDGNSSEIGTIVTDYLKLVPLIANDPQRMKEETERYEQRLNSSLVSYFEGTLKTKNSSWTEWKIFIHGLAFHQHMLIHQVRMGADIPMEQLLEKNWQNMMDAIDPKSMVEIINDTGYLISISPEKHQILTKCEGSLFKEFMFDVSIRAMYFFVGIQTKYTQFINQKEDFFY